VFKECAGPSRDEGGQIIEGLIPEKYFNRQLVKNLIEAPVLSKKKMLAVNMVRIDAALDRGRRDEFARLAAERRFVEREWLD